MSRSSRPWALWLLAGLYAVALGADLLAPHSPSQQHREFPNAPPTWPHWIDADGRFHARPFVHPLEAVPGTFDEYRVDRRQRVPLRFGVAADPGDRGVVGSVGWRWVAVEPPGQLFLLGTDRFGRDRFSRLLHGARISLLAGLLAGLLAVGLGLTLGTLAGFFGGWVDGLVNRLVELVLCLPSLFLLLAVRAALPLDLPASQAFLLVSVLIAGLGWGRTARLARGRALAVRRRGFVAAAEGFGATRWQILWRHGVPHALPIALTQLALMVPQFVLAEVSLTFLGLGMGEPLPSLGTLLVDLQLESVVTSWWTAAPAGLLLVLVLSYHGVASHLERRLGTVAV